MQKQAVRQMAINHIVLNKRSAEWFEPSSFRHLTWRQVDKSDWNLISDRCPVLVELWIP